MGDCIAPNKKRRFPWTKHSPAICIFLFLLFYGSVIVRRCSPLQMSPFDYLFYAVDYSLGFCTRFLPGAVFRLFDKEPTIAAASVYAVVLTVLLCAAASVLLERLYYAQQPEDRPLCVLLLAFFLAGPATFTAIFYDLGIVDLHWFFCVIPFLFLMQRPKLRWLAPLLLLPMVAIYNACMFNWALFCGLITLYELTRAETRSERKKLVALLAAIAVCAGGTTLYFATYEKKNLTYPVEEFNEILLDRGAEMVYYFDGIYYGDPTKGAEAFPGIADAYDLVENNGPTAQNGSTGPLGALFRSVYDQFRRHWEEVYAHNEHAQLKATAAMLFLTSAVLAPALWFFYSFLRLRRKEEKKRSLARLFLLCTALLLPVSAVGTFPFSSDSTRWIAHGFFALFTLILYILYKEKAAAAEQMKSVLRRVPPWAIALYFGIYCFTVLNPYV